MFMKPSDYIDSIVCGEMTLDEVVSKEMEDITNDTLHLHKLTARYDSLEMYNAVKRGNKRRAIETLDQIHDLATSICMTLQMLAITIEKHMPDAVP